jgi:hypothetical protein
VVLALVAGFVLLGHREIWSLLRTRHLPVFDERVRANLTDAMRLTGIFFFIAAVLLIIAFRFDVFERVPLSLIVSGQLVFIGLVYVIGYHYYDRVRPNLGVRGLNLLKWCLVTAGLSLSTIALAIVLHNMVSAWLGFEEAFFFIVGLLVAPGILVISLLTGLVIYFMGLFGTAGRVESL